MSNVITLVYFDGCPNASVALEILNELKVPFKTVNQSELSESNDFLGYSSPSIFVGNQLIYGTITGNQSGGCSLEPLKKNKIRELLKSHLQIKMI